MSETFQLTLPDGKRVTCWRKDALLIRQDVALTGNVILNREPGAEVYERIDPSSPDAALYVRAGRRVDGEPSE